MGQICDMLVKTQNWFSHKHQENVQHSSVKIRTSVSAELQLAKGFREWCQFKWQPSRKRVKNSEIGKQ